MTLEVPTGKTPGDVARRTPAERRAVAGFLIVALTGLIFVFAYLVFYAIVGGFNSPTAVSPEVEAAPLSGIFKSDQQIIASWLGGMFIALAYVILLYQRYFVDHVTIYKRRFRKWEDEGVQLK